MKKFICMFALVFACQAKADDLIEGLEPVAAAPQVIVVYRNQCPDNQENAYQLLKKMYTKVPAIFREKDVMELSNIENHLNIPSNERVIKIDRYTKE